MRHDLTASSFWRALVSYLIVKGESGIQPKKPADRRGFAQLVRAIDVVAEENKGDDVWYRSLVRLRNYLQSGNNGAFENIETELRELQTSALMVPNPDYDDMHFQLSQSYARSLLDALDRKQRVLIERAGDAFRSAKYPVAENAAGAR
jgi:hypothetical protein